MQIRDGLVLLTFRKLKPNRLSVFRAYYYSQSVIIIEAWSGYGYKYEHLLDCYMIQLAGQFNCIELLESGVHTPQQQLLTYPSSVEHGIHDMTKESLCVVDYGAERQ